MNDQIMGLQDSGLDVIAINIVNGQRLSTENASIEDMVVVPVAGNGAWNYWVQVNWTWGKSLFNPAHLISIEYEE